MAVMESKAFATFGPMVASDDVDRAVIAHLRKWLPTYLKQIAFVKDAKLAAPRRASYATVLPTNNEWKNFCLPGVFVATARTEGTPDHDGSGDVVASWLVAISAMVRGRDAAEARRNASLYELGIRMAMEQHGDLGGFAIGTRWSSGGESRPLVDPLGDSRWLAEGASQYAVVVGPTHNWLAGPDVPDEDAYEAWPVVTQVDELVVTAVQPGSLNED